MDVHGTNVGSPLVLATPKRRFAFPDLLSDDTKYMNLGIPLYQAALKGEWEAAFVILQQKPDCIIARITKQGDTILHVAASAARSTKFIANLVELIVESYEKEEIAIQNNVGNTALSLAAASGSVPIAEVIVKANSELPFIRSEAGLTPLHIASMLGHRDMVWYLWPLTETGLTKQELIKLLINTINTDLYDVAQDILNGRPELAIAEDGPGGETPLHVLARKSSKHMRSKPSPCGRCYHIFGKWGAYTENTLQFLVPQLVDRLWSQVVQQTNPGCTAKKLVEHFSELLFVAVEEGNLEFLTKLINSYPDLIWSFDHNGRSILHVAIQCRQRKIFELIRGTGAIKDCLALYSDDEGNNMLHLAAMLPTSDRLNCISGAALQMQQEIWWFKETEGLVHPQIAQAPNKKMQTARALFIKEHEDLRKRGEEWMTKTASSCSVVAALIAGVVFQAAGNVPGGDSSDNNQSKNNTTNNTAASANSNSDDPLGQGSLYWVFALSDSLSLISSTASILMFLSILTSTYTVEDFLKSLPLKLMIGMTLLFISIATMMIAFTAIFSIVYQHGLLWVMTSTLSCIPILLFGVQIFPLLVQVYRSTIGCNLYSKPKDRLF